MRTPHAARDSVPVLQPGSQRTARQRGAIRGTRLREVRGSVEAPCVPDGRETLLPAPFPALTGPYPKPYPLTLLIRKNSGVIKPTRAAPGHPPPPPSNLTHISARRAKHRQLTSAGGPTATGSSSSLLTDCDRPRHDTETGPPLIHARHSRGALFGCRAARQPGRRARAAAGSLLPQ